MVLSMQQPPWLMIIQCDLLPGQRGPVNEPEPGPEPEITIDNGQLSQQGNLLEASCDRVINLTGQKLESWLNVVKGN